MNTIYRFDDFPKLKEQLGSISAVSGLLGLKSATLGQISELNIQIPPGFILSTEAYKQFLDNKCLDIPDELWEDILQELRPLEEQSELKYASPRNPLLLTVRGDSPNYMVGMLDAVTNIGLNDLTARAMERNTNNRSFVWDCYRRLVQDYGVVVNKIPLSVFQEELEKFRASRNLHSFSSFSALDYIQLTKINKAIVVQKSGKPFPQDPFEQLRKIICAIFSSQSLSRVKLYKQKTNLKDENLTSIIIMPMIFGNRSITTSSTIIATRDLVSGSPDVIGESAIQATCRDLSYSQRDSLPLTQLSKENSALYNKVTTIGQTLEKFFKKPQIIDYVYEQGEVYVMQASNAQLTATGKFRVAKDMVESGLITKEESLCNFEPEDICQLLAPQLAAAPSAAFCKGNPSGNACVVGKVCLTNESVFELTKKGESAILFKKSISSTDFEALIASSAVVTCIGNNFSLAASLTRLFRKTAALGCQGLVIDIEAGEVKSGDVTIKVGDEVTVTGDGQVIVGPQELIQPESQSDEFANEVLKWADEVRKDKIRVFTIAANATDASKAVQVGSDGVGTLSIESFFDGDNKRLITDLIDSSNEDAVGAFENHLHDQLKEIFTNAGSKAIVTIRLFDQELTTYCESPLELAKEIGVLLAQKDRDGDDFASQEELDNKLQELENMKKMKRKNPSLGSRAIRLLIQRPDLLAAELKAILNASKEGRGSDDGSADDVYTRIVVPYVSDFREINFFAKKFEEISLETGEKAKIGVEIDTVRGCLCADKIAEVTDFITLSIPQLVDATFSIDINEAKRKMLPEYQEKKILLTKDLTDKVPKSVEELMKSCSNDAKQSKADGEIGLFSEEFNNPNVIKKYTDIGINSFICRPQAVPIARLCAAKNLIEKQT